MSRSLMTPHMAPPTWAQPPTRVPGPTHGTALSADNGPGSTIVSGQEEQPPPGRSSPRYPGRRSGGGAKRPSGAEGTRRGSHALKTIRNVPGAEVYLVQQWHREQGVVS